MTKEKRPQHRGNDVRARLTTTKLNTGIVAQPRLILNPPNLTESNNSTEIESAMKGRQMMTTSALRLITAEPEVRPTPALALSQLLTRVVAARRAAGKPIPRELAHKLYRLCAQVDDEQRFPDRKEVAA